METDYFNGEIVMLGRLHGVDTPTNEFLQRYAEAASREVPAGSIDVDRFDAEWDKWLQ